MQKFRDKGLIPLCQILFLTADGILGNALPRLPQSLCLFLIQISWDLSCFPMCVDYNAHINLNRDESLSKHMQPGLKYTGYVISRIIFFYNSMLSYSQGCYDCFDRHTFIISVFSTMCFVCSMIMPLNAFVVSPGDSPPVPHPLSPSFPKWR